MSYVNLKPIFPVLRMKNYRTLYVPSARFHLGSIFGLILVCMCMLFSYIQHKPTKRFSIKRLIIHVLSGKMNLISFTCKTA